MTKHANDCRCLQCMLPRDERAPLCRRHATCLAPDGHGGKCMTLRRWPGLFVRALLVDLLGGAQ